MESTNERHIPSISQHVTDASAQKKGTHMKENIVASSSLPIPIGREFPIPYNKEWLSVYPRASELEGRQDCPYQIVVNQPKQSAPTPDKWQESFFKVQNTLALHPVTAVMAGYEDQQCHVEKRSTQDVYGCSSPRIADNNQDAAEFQNDPDSLVDKITTSAVGMRDRELLQSQNVSRADHSKRSALEFNPTLDEHEHSTLHRPASLAFTPIPASLSTRDIPSSLIMQGKIDGQTRRNSTVQELTEKIKSLEQSHQHRVLKSKKKTIALLRIIEEHLATKLRRLKQRQRVLLQQQQRQRQQQQLYHVASQMSTATRLVPIALHHQQQLQHIDPYLSLLLLLQNQQNQQQQQPPRGIHDHVSSADIHLR